MGDTTKHGRTRREFLKIAGVGGLGAASLYLIGCPEAAGTVTTTKTVEVPKGMPASSTGYLVHDEIKCVNCKSCMSACSLARYGKGSHALARRQVIHSSWDIGPDDVRHADCRQCVYTPCIDACPSGAFHVDADNGNVRTIDEEKCAAYQKSIAPDVCKLCIEACPYMPSRVVWNPEYGQGIEGVGTVCDLCKYAPYWSGGGVDGTQACVSVCPMKAIKLVHEVPDQTDNLGYDVNLRTANWDETMDVPTKYGELARALTSPVRDERGVMRPGGGSTYDEDPVPPPYPTAEEGWPYPAPGYPV